MNKIITLCLLTYNHKHSIEKSINSILSQTYSNFKLLISDDNSNDGTWEYINEISKTDSRIKCIRTPSNYGMAGNANFVVRHVDTEFFGIIHHDDIYSKELLSEWVNIMSSDKEIAYVFNDYEFDGEKSQELKKINGNLDRITDGNRFINEYLLRFWRCPVRGTALIRKKYWDKVNGMNEKFGFLADIDLWINLAEDNKVGFSNKTLVNVLKERPKNYPKEYKGFSWDRRFLLYDIHWFHSKRNNIELIKKFKINIDILKWIIYSIIKKERFPSIPKKEYEFKIINHIRDFMP